MFYKHICRLLFFVCVIFLFNSCQEDSPQPQEIGYIKGNFGSQYLNYTQSQGLADSVANVFAYSSVGSNISIIRYDSISSSPYLRIDIMDVLLDTLTLPIEFSSIQTHKGFAIIQFNDQQAISKDTSSTMIADTYIGKTYGNDGDNEMKIRLNSKSNDILVGTFEGKMKRRFINPQDIEVTKGEFKIRIIRKETK